MVEEWKQIAGYPGYEISNQGRVRSMDRVIPFKSWNRIEKGKILSLVIDKSTGYARVVLHKNGTKKLLNVHRLVAKAFLERKEEEHFVDHLNTVRHDNRAENLRWVTAKGNSNNPITLEHHLHTTRNKAVIQYDKDMNFIAEYESAQAAAKATGTSRSHLCEVCNGNTYRHTANGFIWKFKN
jgi:hypothetical protein